MKHSQKVVKTDRERERDKERECKRERQTDGQTETVYQKRPS